MSYKKMNCNKQLIIIITCTSFSFVAFYIFILMYQRPLPIIPSGSSDVQILHIEHYEESMILTDEMTALMGYDEIIEALSHKRAEDITELLDHDEVMEILSRYYVRRRFTERNPGLTQWHIHIGLEPSGWHGRRREVFVGGGANVVYGAGLGTAFRTIDDWELLLEELNAAKYHAQNAKVNTY